MAFELHPDLLRDGICLGSFPLCQVLLIDDAAYPWFVLVPARENIRDTIDLDPVDFELLWNCLLYTSPSPRDQRGSRMPSSA